MNIILLAAAIGAINPGFIGDWCDIKNQHEISFGKTTFAPEGYKWCAYNKNQSKKPNELNLEYFSCSGDDGSYEQTTNMIKYSINKEGLMSYYVDKYGDATPDHQLYRCKR